MQLSLRRRWLVGVLAGVGLVAVGCGSEGTTSADAAAGKPVVVATTGIWTDVVANVACDEQAAIETLIPNGSDPHAFEPSLLDRGVMDAAALVVANGLGLEEGMGDTLGAVERAGTPVFRVGEHLDPIRPEADGADPHIWFDPQRVSAALPSLAERLVADAGLDAAAVDACLVAYQAELAEVDAEIGALVAPLPADRRRLVTNHDSLGYFADRYGFTVIGTVIPSRSGLAEANPAQLEALALVIEQTGVPAIFSETQHSSDDAEALAARVGEIEVVTLFAGTLGDPASGADTYVGFLRTNARSITEALGR